jgi:hypothetical protein
MIWAMLISGVLGALAAWFVSWRIYRADVRRMEQRQADLEEAVSTPSFEGGVLKRMPPDVFR